jgi:dTMP kinase
MRGALVAIEGIDRAGKSSVLERLPALLEGLRPSVAATGELRSPIGPFIRENLDTMSALQKTYLFAADRAWTYEREATPGLERGDLVVWDRYVASALAYRNVEVRPTDVGLLRLVGEINRPFPEPDLTIWIDITVDTSIRRAGQGEQQLYGADFLRAVREEYRRRADEAKWVRIDGEAPPIEVAQEAAREIRIMLERLRR